MHSYSRIISQKQMHARTNVDATTRYLVVINLDTISFGATQHHAKSMPDAPRSTPTDLSC